MQTFYLAVGLRKNEPKLKAWVDEWVRTNLKNGKFNEIYKQYFKPPYPARSALGVNGLARGGHLEIECIAYAPGGQS